MRGLLIFVELLHFEYVSLHSVSVHLLSLLSQLKKVRCGY